MTDIFTFRVKKIIGSIPVGKVTTYGRVACWAGNSKGARQVARILHSNSEKYSLPWHRVVNRHGKISSRPSLGHIFQRQLLEEEGIVFDDSGRIDYSLYLWYPEPRAVEGE